MTAAPHSIDPTTYLDGLLAQASPDLMRHETVLELRFGRREAQADAFAYRRAFRWRLRPLVWCNAC